MSNIPNKLAAIFKQNSIKKIKCFPQSEEESTNLEGQLKFDSVINYFESKEVEDRSNFRPDNIYFKNNKFRTLDFSNNNFSQLQDNLNLNYNAQNHYQIIPQINIVSHNRINNNIENNNNNITHRTFNSNEEEREFNFEVSYLFPDIHLTKIILSILTLLVIIFLPFTLVFNSNRRLALCSEKGDDCFNNVIKNDSNKNLYNNYGDEGFFTTSNSKINITNEINNEIFQLSEMNIFKAIKDIKYFELNNKLENDNFIELIPQQQLSTINSFFFDQTMIKEYLIKNNVKNKNNSKNNYFARSDNLIIETKGNNTMPDNPNTKFDFEGKQEKINGKRSLSEYNDDFPGTNPNNFNFLDNYEKNFSNMMSKIVMLESLTYQKFKGEWDISIDESKRLRNHFREKTSTNKTFNAFSHFKKLKNFNLNKTNSKGNFKLTVVKQSALEYRISLLLFDGEYMDRWIRIDAKCIESPFEISSINFSYNKKHEIKINFSEARANNCFSIFPEKKEGKEELTHETTNNLPNKIFLNSIFTGDITTGKSFIMGEKESKIYIFLYF